VAAQGLEGGRGGKAGAVDPVGILRGPTAWASSRSRSGKRAERAARRRVPQGEDLFTANGVAIVIDTIDPYAVLYVGEGDSVRTSSGACSRSTT